VCAEQFLLEFKRKLRMLRVPFLELAEGYFLFTFSFNLTHTFDVFRVSGDPV